MRQSGPAPLLRVLAACSILMAGACAGGQSLQITKVEGFARPPSNVALYFKVTRPDGQSLSLSANDISVYEDGKLVSSKKAKRALLPPRHVVDRFVLILVDMSGPLVDSEYLPNLFRSVDAFGGRMVKLSRVGLAAFDGNSDVETLVGFTDPDPQAGLDAFRKFRPRSRNTDLWGAFVAGLKVLDEAAKKSKLPYQDTTLVLVTDRTDRAGRHDRAQALARVQKSKANVFVIGIGDTINREELEPFGKTAFMSVAHPRDLDKPFLVFADRIEDRLGQDYLFSYCSPKRKGKHDVELRLAAGQWRGRVEHNFSAKGFTNGCDPKDPPIDSDGGPESAAATAGALQSGTAAAGSTRIRRVPVEDDASDES